VGNRLGTTVDNGNRLLEDSNYTYSYNDEGNLTQKVSKSTGETTTYTYDSENRLTQVTKPGMTASYKYDPFGRRIEKNVDGVITKYLYDEEDIIAEYDGNNQLIAHYIHGPGIDEPIAMVKNSQSYFYHFDGLGSVTAITDSTGSVIQRYDYDSFGNIVSMLDPNFKQPYTYTSREYDLESGLYYYRARYYDAKIGKFISEDPIGLKGGINKYVYVGNNPVRFIDPLGLALGDPNTSLGGVIPYKVHFKFLGKCLVCDEQKLNTCLRPFNESTSCQDMNPKDPLDYDYNKCIGEFFSMGACYVNACHIEDCKDECKQ
jgi:RHS repeat-associated protein